MNISPIKPNMLQSISMQVLGGAMGGPIGVMLGGINNLPQLGQVLGQLSGLFGGAGAQSPAAAFTPRPQPFSMTNINITIMNNPMASLGQPQSNNALTSFGKAPMVGSESDWGAFNQAVNSRITGSDSAKNAIGMHGNIWSNGAGNTAEKAAIGWAMQKNDKLRFDADRKQFYVTNQDGSTRDVCSLQDMVNTVNKNGGASPSNGAGFQAVGNFIDGLLKNTGAPGSASGGATAASQNPMQQIMELLQKLLQALGGGQAAGAGAGAAAAGSPMSSITGGGSAGSASGTGAASGSGSASGAGSAGSFENMVDSVGSSIDNMMGQAESLMKSDKQSDQLKGQMLMQKAMRLFEMISKLMEQRSQMASKAIQAIK